MEEKKAASADRKNTKGNNRSMGSLWERYAGSRMSSAGLSVIAYNFRCRLGEIDIVARDGDYIVFTEVKCRKSRKAGNPLEAVDLRKQGIIRRVASFFLLRFGFREDTPCRFDVFGIEADAGGRVLNEYWVKDAF